MIHEYGETQILTQFLLCVQNKKEIKLTQFKNEKKKPPLHMKISSAPSQSASRSITIAFFEKVLSNLTLAYLPLGNESSLKILAAWSLKPEWSIESLPISAETSSPSALASASLHRRLLFNFAGAQDAVNEMEKTIARGYQWSCSKGPT